MNKNWFYLTLIAIFSLVGMKALFHPGLFTAHDISHQVVRLYYYFQAFNDGQLPPYWIGQLANHFGYPLFFFSYPLPWIIGTLIMKMGVDISNVIKFLFFISFFSSGITMYLFVNILLKNRFSALLSSVIYLWLPYHFLIIFVGASMGIAFIFAFLPAIFLGIHLTATKSKYGIIVLSLGITGIILSHIMHLVFITPIIFFFVLWEFVSIKNRFKFIKDLFLGIILSILISSFYLIPATYYSQFTRVHQESGFSQLYKRNFINFSQLLYSQWGYSPIVNNAKNGEISFQLGFAQWIAVSILAVLILFNKISKDHRNLSILLLVCFTFSIFLTLDFSKTIWAFVVKFISVDFPFRLLLPASFIASLCAGIIVANTKNLQIIFTVFLIIVALYTNRNHINVNLYTEYPASTYLDLETETTTNTFNEYLPIQASPKLLGKPWNEAVGENFRAQDTKQTTNLLYFNLIVEKESSISLGQFYFPGQNLYLDDKRVHFDFDKDGRVNFIAPPGQHKVMIKYQQTSLIKLSKILTISGVLILLFLFFINLKDSRKQLAVN